MKRIRGHLKGIFEIKTNFIMCHKDFHNSEDKKGHQRYKEAYLMDQGIGRQEWMEKTVSSKWGWKDFPEDEKEETERRGGCK